MEKADALQEQVGVPVITTSTGPDGVFDDAFRTSLQLLGQLFGRQERTQELIAFIDSQTAAVSYTHLVVPTYRSGRPITYLITLVNAGTADLTGLTVADDLGGYTFNGATVYPLSYTCLLYTSP